MKPMRLKKNSDFRTALICHTTSIWKFLKWTFSKEKIKISIPPRLTSLIQIHGRHKVQLMTHCGRLVHEKKTKKITKQKLSCHPRRKYAVIRNVPVKDAPKRIVYKERKAKKWNESMTLTLQGGSKKKATFDSVLCPPRCNIFILFCLLKLIWGNHF